MPCQYSEEALAAYRYHQNTCRSFHYESCYIRSDNGTEFTAIRLREWLKTVEVATAYIKPGNPWENGYCESFNSKMRDEFLNLEIFDTMFEVEILTRRWIREYNTVRPHSSLCYRPPAPQVIAA